MDTVTENKMELPADILPLIRAFAKPRLRYPEAYKEVLRCLKMKRWPELMEKLSGEFVSANNAYSVVKAFLVFEDTCQLVDNLYRQTPTEYNKGTHALVFETRKFMVDVLTTMVHSSGLLFDQLVYTINANAPVFEQIIAKVNNINKKLSHWQ
jgi:hypothetical protein